MDTERAETVTVAQGRAKEQYRIFDAKRDVDLRSNAETIKDQAENALISAIAEDKAPTMFLCNIVKSWWNNVPKDERKPGPYKDYYTAMENAVATDEARERIMQRVEEHRMRNAGTWVSPQLPAASLAAGPGLAIAPGGGSGLETVYLSGTAQQPTVVFRLSPHDFAATGLLGGKDAHGNTLASFSGDFEVDWPPTSHELAAKQMRLQQSGTSFRDLALERRAAQERQISYQPQHGQQEQCPPQQYQYQHLQDALGQQYPQQQQQQQKWSEDFGSVDWPPTSHELAANQNRSQQSGASLFGLPAAQFRAQERQNDYQQQGQQGEFPPHQYKDLQDDLGQRYPRQRQRFSQLQQYTQQPQSHQQQQQQNSQYGQLAQQGQHPPEERRDDDNMVDALSVNACLGAIAQMWATNAPRGRKRSHEEMDVPVFDFGSWTKK
ncbi:hypothetical protein B0H63DRAFT_446194 [Podospora didyma]|uniref:Uncharacterized protein n=1 Tax=Podospora didyma TaxID=330526 RepID=A0AAE0NYI4_9PEZI|nr:hypothetical protein B0H63DRAFT_446194 [Podospora didyma]